MQLCPLGETALARGQLIALAISDEEQSKLEGSGSGLDSYLPELAKVRLPAGSPPLHGLLSWSPSMISCVGRWWKLSVS